MRQLSEWHLKSKATKNSCLLEWWFTPIIVTMNSVFVQQSWKKQSLVWKSHTYTPKKNSHKKKTSLVWRLFLLLVIFVWGAVFWLSRPLSLNQTLVFEQWSTLAREIDSLSSLSKLKLQLYTKLYRPDVASIQVGSYQFAGFYTPREFFARLAQWPQSEYQSVTLLEWRSVFDIDTVLADQWLIQAGEYLSYVQDSHIIAQLSEHHQFLRDVLLERGSILSLEWFLYPDTYFIDSQTPVVQQLVQLQLQNFFTKVREPLQWRMDWFHALLVDRWLDISERESDSYAIIILASIIEKEERNSANRPTVAGVFVNRLDRDMLLGADITLCYGLQQPYELCTPDIIVQELDDVSNLYNTRRVPGLTPQPIVSPTADSVAAVVWFIQTDYVYYLHAPDGRIYYARTNDQHNQNKQRYLR